MKIISRNCAFDRRGLCCGHMTELDAIWSQLLTAAAANADGGDRESIARFLRLRSNNDAIRTAGVNWLLDSAIEIAADLSRNFPHLRIERVEPHRFERGTSTMAGSLLVITLGVRCINIEAGWTRAPGDGVMRRGALAAANVKHFGRPRSDAELRLMPSDTAPVWLDAGDTRIDLAWIVAHLSQLTQ